MIEQLASVFGKLIILIGLGFFLGKRKIMDEEMKKKITTLVVKAILPFNIISCADQAYSKENATGMLVVIGLSCIYFIVALGVLIPVTARWHDPSRRNVFINMAIFANCGFIGFPLMNEMQGDLGMLNAVAYNISYQLFFFSIGVYLLMENGKFSLKSLFSNFTFYCTIASIAMYFSGLRFPAFASSAIASIGNCISPMTMMLIGWEISQMKFSEISRNKLCYYISGLRLIVFPLLTVLALKLAGISGPVAVSMVLLSSLPCGSMTVILASEQGKDSSLAAQAVAHSTIFMLITLPMMALLANTLFMH